MKAWWSSLHTNLALLVFTICNRLMHMLFIKLDPLSPSTFLEGDVKLPTERECSHFYLCHQACTPCKICNMCAVKYGIKGNKMVYSLQLNLVSHCLFSFLCACMCCIGNLCPKLPLTEHISPTSRKCLRLLLQHWLKCCMYFEIKKDYLILSI